MKKQWGRSLADTLTAADVAKMSAAKRDKLVRGHRVSDAKMCQLEAEADKLYPLPDDGIADNVADDDAIVTIDDDYAPSADVPSFDSPFDCIPDWND